MVPPGDRGRLVRYFSATTGPYSVVLAHPVRPDVAAPLVNRRLLLEIKVWGLRYLCPAVVTTVRDEDDLGLTHQGVDVTFTYHTKRKRFI